MARRAFRRRELKSCRRKRGFWVCGVEGEGPSFWSRAEDELEAAEFTDHRESGGLRDAASERLGKHEQTGEETFRKKERA